MLVSIVLLIFCNIVMTAIADSTAPGFVVLKAIVLVGAAALVYDALQTADRVAGGLAPFMP